MNEQIASTSTPSLKERLLLWLNRYKEGYFNFTLCIMAILGSLPGAGLMIIYSLAQRHHVPLTTLQTIAFSMSGIVLLVFGLLLGIIAGCVFFAVQVLCFPTQTQNRTTVKQ